MMKEVSKPDYSRMSEGELKLLLKKHQQLLNNTRLINGLPDKGQRLRNSINEIEKYLLDPSSPMDCDIVNQFNQMTMSINDDNDHISQTEVYLEKSENDNVLENKFDNNFSDERLNEVKQRLKARQVERQKNATVTTAKLIQLEEAVKLYNEEKKQTEDYLIQQTTERLLGNMSLSKTTFGLPTKTNLTYRKTTTESNVDDDDPIDELGRDKAEIVSDHDSEEVDYPDVDEVENVED